VQWKTVHETSGRREGPEESGLLFARGDRGTGGGDVFSKRIGRRVTVPPHGGLSRILYSYSPIARQWRRHTLCTHPGRCIHNDRFVTTRPSHPLREPHRLRAWPIDWSIADTDCFLEVEEESKNARVEKIIGGLSLLPFDGRLLRFSYVDSWTVARCIMYFKYYLSLLFNMPLFMRIIIIIIIMMICKFCTIDLDFVQLFCTIDLSLRSVLLGRANSNTTV